MSDTDQCIDGIEWINKVFGDCVITTRDKISFSIGMFSNCLWLVCSSPQIYHNFKTKHVDGISPFYFILIVSADLFSLFGAIFTHALASQIVTGIIYVTLDVILLTQMALYGCCRRKHKKNDIEFDPKNNESQICEDVLVSDHGEMENDEYAQKNIVEKESAKENTNEFRDNIVENKQINENNDNICDMCEKNGKNNGIPTSENNENQNQNENGISNSSLDSVIEDNSLEYNLDFRNETNERNRLNLNSLKHIIKRIFGQELITNNTNININSNTNEKITANTNIESNIDSNSNLSSNINSNTNIKSNINENMDFNININSNINRGTNINTKLDTKISRKLDRPFSPFFAAWGLLPSLVSARSQIDYSLPYRGSLLFGSVSGWIGSSIYVTSRIVQLRKNLEQRIVKDFSAIYVSILVLANATYSASVFVRSVDEAYLWKQTPFIIGSLLPMAFDSFTLGQIAYGRCAFAEEYNTMK